MFLARMFATLFTDTSDVRAISRVRAPQLRQSILPSWTQLARRVVPQAVEASIIPAVILLVFLHVASSTVAIAAALGWVIAATAVRVATRRQVSGLTILSITRLLVRSVMRSRPGAPSSTSCRARSAVPA